MTGEGSKVAAPFDSEHTFSVPLEAAPRGGCWVRLPRPVDESLGGGRRRVAVKARFDRSVEYRGSVVAMGEGARVLGVIRAIRDGLGKQIGDTVVVELSIDREPREVRVPEDVSTLLAQEGLRSLFDSLSYTHRKEYVRWIEGARREETRLRRLSQLPDKLRSGKRV
ncbi:MAG: YdeI/OmpD-associated family protein [Acidobacteriota bacterium]